MDCAYSRYPSGCGQPLQGLSARRVISIGPTTTCAFNFFRVSVFSLTDIMPVDSAAGDASRVLALDHPLTPRLLRSANPPAGFDKLRSLPTPCWDNPAGNPHNQQALLPCKFNFSSCTIVLTCFPDRNRAPRILRKRFFENSFATAKNRPSVWIKSSFKPSF